MHTATLTFMFSLYGFDLKFNLKLFFNTFREAYVGIHKKVSSLQQIIFLFLAECDLVVLVIIFFFYIKVISKDQLWDYETFLKYIFV